MPDRQCWSRELPPDEAEAKPSGTDDTRRSSQAINSVAPIKCVLANEAFEFELLQSFLVAAHRYGERD